MDEVLRRSAMLVMLVMLLLSIFVMSDPLTTLVLLGAAVFGWLALAMINAKTAAALPALSLAIEHGVPTAESMLAEQLAKRPLARPIRLQLYAKLAGLRHRESRYAESAAIAQSLLAQPTPDPSRHHRPQLLLMLVEAQLESRNLIGAWMALSQLARTPVSLQEAILRMALHTRYLLAIGQNQAAMYQADHRSQLAELMPGPQCGAFAAMLAIASERLGETDHASRFWHRANLLCSDEQLQRVLHAADPASQGQPAAGS